MRRGRLASLADHPSPDAYFFDGACSATVSSIAQDEPLNIVKVDPFWVTGSVLAPGGLEPPR